MLIKDFLDRAFKLRDAAHRAHLATESFSKHEALGSFYDDLIEATDKIIEIYQGCYGKLEKARDEAIIKDIVDEANWIANNRDKIARGNQVLENQIDELGAIYARTVYKLRNLH